MADVFSNQRDWAYLFPEAIDMIVDKFDDSFSSFLGFISVCQHWRVVAVEGKDRKKKKDDNTKKLFILKTCRNRLPLLFFETLTGSLAKERHFFSVPSSDYGICSYQLDRHLDIDSLKYFGSSFGWLFATIRQQQQSSHNMDLVLFNPFTRVTKYLPIFPDNYRRGRVICYNKGVLSSDPSKAGDGGYELVVIHDAHERLACYRSRTNSWMFVQTDEHRRFDDVVFYRGKIYASTSSCGVLELVEVNFDVGSTRVVISSYERKCFQMLHLVVSTRGDLLMVKQMEDNWFKVFKLCCCPEEWTWVEVHNLGDEAMFLGSGGIGTSCFSGCVSTSEFPQCQPNHIYYTNSTSCQHGYEERGAFNLELNQHLKFPCAVRGVVRTSCQFWIVPNFRGD